MKLDIKKICFLRIIIFSVLMLIGTTIILNTQRLFSYIINTNLVINPNNTYAYNLWRDTPMPITMDIYFFNWTNPEDIYNHTIKPHLHEMGPYRFREKKKKVDIVWHTNGTISFKHQKYWFFDAEYSSGSLEDEITSINPVAVSATSQSSNFNYFLQKTLSYSMSAMIKHIHITKTVREIIFEGYDDPFLNLARTVPITKQLEIELPSFEKFGWFVERNGSKDYEGLFTMGTGEGEVPFGALERWNHANTTKYYPGECGRVKGSAGEFWTQNLNKNDIELFFTDLCRSINLEYEEDVSIMKLNSYKYVAGEKTFDNGAIDPANRCYCEKSCVKSGLASVSRCRFGAPGYISFPHFYAADPFYLEKFDGLAPDKSKHEFYILIEPRLGIPLYVSGKFQINLLMTPNQYIGLFNNVPELYFPILWFEEQVTITNDIASNFQLLLSIPTICYSIAGVFILLGILCLLKDVLLKRILCFRNTTDIEQIKHDLPSDCKESVPLNYSRNKL